MLDPIVFNVCFQIVTPESAEYGDFADSGFEHEEYICDDFADVISLVERYGDGEWSCSDGAGWLNSSPTIDYTDASETTYSLHPVNDRSARYMRLAKGVVG